MARFVTQVASLGVFWTVPGYMARPLAIVARVVRHSIHAAGLWTASRNVAGLPAIVAGRHVRTLQAILGEVALAVAAVAAGRILLAIARIVADLVALATLFAAAIVTATAAVTTARLRTFACEMARLIAFVAYAA